MRRQTANTSDLEYAQIPTEDTRPEDIRPENSELSLEHLIIDLNTHDTDPSLLAKLWSQSLTQNPWITALRLLQALMFISNNVAVNWYSFDKNWRDKFDYRLLISMNLLFAFGTIVSNAFSKVVDLGDEIDGLNLNDAEKTFINNLSEKLFEHTFAGSNDNYYLCLSQHDYDIFATRSADHEQYEKFKKSLQFLQLKFKKMTGKTLTFSPMLINTITQDISQNNARLILVTSADKHDISFSNDIDQDLEFVRTYHQGWLGRLSHCLEKREFGEAILTLVKALLWSLRWLIAKGLPGFVVLATGIVSFSYVFEAEKVQETWAQVLLFIAVAMITWMGKVLINNRLKGDLTDLEMRRFGERVLHGQHPCPNINWSVALPVAGVSILSLLPYNITTAWFYTADGIDTALHQVNRFTGLELALPLEIAQVVTYLAVAASIPMAIATNSKPAYTVLTQRKPNNVKNPSHQQTTQEKYALLWNIFLLATLLDGLKCGDNAIRNARGTFNVIAHQYPELSSMTEGIWADLLTYDVAIFNTLFNIFFAIDRAANKFEHCMHLCENIKRSVTTEYRRLYHRDSHSESLMDPSEQEMPNNTDAHDLNHTLNTTLTLTL